MSRSIDINKTGLLLCALVIGLAGLSHAFPYGVDIFDAPLKIYVGLALIAGGLWTVLLLQLKRSDRDAPAIWIVIAIGLVMRAAMFVSEPVLEDDSYRYLWDGAVTAHGLDPYRYAPAELTPNPLFETEASSDRGGEFATLQTLAEEHSLPYSRINYPYISTIYPHWRRRPSLSRTGSIHLA